jgi:hypothetical protein
MPTARAIHYKYGLAPAAHFGLFVSIPIAFASAASAHIVRPHIPPTSKARQRVPLPQSGVER